MSLLAGCSADDEGQAESYWSEVDLLSDPDEVGRLPLNVPDGFALHDLGVVITEEGVAEALDFATDEETRALHVVAVSHPGTFVSLVEAVAPDGSLWVMPEPPEPVSPELDRYVGGFPGPALSPNKTLPRPRAAATLLPNTPALTMQPGAWRFRVGAYRNHYDEGAGRYDNAPLNAAVRVAVVERRSPPPSRGVIDLTLTFAPPLFDTGLTAASAPTESNIQNALAFVDESLGAVGIELGEVTYQDAPELPREIDLGGPACLGGPDVERAFDRAPEPRPGSLQVLFIDRFICNTASGDAGSQLLAMSNGAPGRPFATRDGLVITTHYRYFDLWETNIAHELGHFLGLFHTCEGDLGSCDNIPDTPEGPQAGANLMYPQVSEVSDPIFTAQQGEVMRLSPLVRPEP